MKIVIMAGGKGIRLWPRSVGDRPKQFLALASQESMLQQTYNRFRKFVDAADLYVVAGHSYAPLIFEQLPQLDRNHMIVEPDQRDTGPCIALTSRFFLQQGIDDVMVTAPADQYIPDDKALMETLLEAEQLARKDHSIVTLGIIPSRPETGYGYIHAAPEETTSRARRVLKFVEKPNEQRVHELLLEANMYWNSGIFIWKPSTIEYYLKLYQQEMWEKLWLSKEPLDSVYAALPKISVDYAIVEKAATVFVIPFRFVWDDIGSWTAMERIFPKDEQGNIKSGNIYTHLAHNSIIYAEEQSVIAIGVEDLIIVSTKNGLLVCRKSDEQHIKKATEALQFAKPSG